MSAALGAIDARDDFVETINLRKLGVVLQGIQVTTLEEVKSVELLYPDLCVQSQLKDQKKGFVNLGISVLKDADDEAVRESACLEERRLAPSVKSQWISSSGVPTVLLQV